MYLCRNQNYFNNEKFLFFSFLFFSLGCSGCDPGCNDTESNGTTILTLLVELPKTSKSDCYYDDYPYDRMQLGVNPCDLFERYFEDLDVHRLEIDVSGTCADGSGFSKEYRGVTSQLGIDYPPETCTPEIGENPIEVTLFSIPDVLQLCIDNVPRSLNEEHETTTYQVTIRYRTKCSGTDSTCECPENNHYTGFYEISTIYTETAANGAIYSSECGATEPYNFIRLNSSFSSENVACYTDSACSL